MAAPVLPLIIDDTSPLILYQPFGDIFTGVPDTSAGWNLYYTVSAFAHTPSGPGLQVGSSVGNGTSLHLTACDGAALRIDWNGTDITIFGTLVPPPASDGVDVTYSVVLDGTATTNYIFNVSSSPTVDTAATDVLASFTDLPEGEHSVQLTLHNPDANGVSGNRTDGPLLVFDRALVEMSPGKLSPSPTTTLGGGTPTPTGTAQTAPVPDDEIAYRGQWNFMRDLIPGSTAAFHTSNNVGDKATLQFNGSAISIDSEEPITLSARASFTASAPTLLYLRTGLDPAVMHLLEVVNAGADPSAAGDNAGSLLVLAAVNVTTVHSSGAPPVGAATTSSGLSKGGIAALAIGLTLAVAAVAAATFFFVRRRRRIARRKRELLVNPRINRAGRLSFLFSTRRHSQGAERAAQKAREHETEAVGVTVLDIRSPAPDAREKQDESDDDDEGDGDVDVGDEAQRYTTAEKGKARDTRRSNASKNSDGSYSIELPDLTIAQVPRGYLPMSTVPSTASPPRTIPGTAASPASPTSPALPTSPRSPRPRGPREMQGRESTRGILLSNIVTAHTSVDEHGLAVPPFLPPANISPLRVEFATELQERPERRTERHVSTGTAVSLPQSLQQALIQPRRSSQVPIAPVSPEPEAPEPTRPDTVFSFLNMNNSSTSTSLLSPRSQRQSGSNSTGKSQSSSHSKRNTGSEHSTQSMNVNWASLPPDRRISLGLSMTVTGGPTASRPSLAPSVLLQPVPLPPPVSSLPTISTDEQTLSSSGSGEPEGPDQPFPYDAGGQLPSPTDSIPFTVSDIHFRHSTHSSMAGQPESRRVSAQRLSGSHRIPHPPLPGAASNPSSPTRAAHHRQESAGGSQTVPPFIVQRILGRVPASTPHFGGSPTAGQFASATGSMGRAAGAPAAGSTSPVPVSPPPPPPPAAAGGRGSGGGQAQGAGSGSGTTVFGFQLGRHR